MESARRMMDIGQLARVALLASCAAVFFRSLARSIAFEIMGMGPMSINRKHTYIRTFIHTYIGRFHAPYGSYPPKSVETLIAN